MISSYYEVLGVNSDCSLEEVKKAYKEKLLISHPDKIGNESSSIQVNKLQEAYKVLSDSELRRKYDESLKEQYKHQGFLGSGDGLDDYSLDEFYFNPALMEYCMDCPRCHGKDGFHFSEDTLEEHAQERSKNGFQVFAQCSACSLWIKVNFDLAAEYEEAN